MVRHWCHVCNSFVHIDNATMKCATCEQDIIEVVQDETPPPEPPIVPNAAPAPEYHQINLDPNNPLGQIFGMVTQMLGNAGGNGLGGNRPGYAHQAQQMPPFFIFPNGNAGVHANNGQQGVPNGANGPQGPAEFQQAQLFPFPQMLNLNAQGGSLQGLLQGLFGPQQVGDYVSDAGMASLLDRLFRQHQSSQVPAGKDVIDNLPTVTFTKETATGECAICKCDWEEKESAVDLPCHHLFHKDCIKKWFETSNLCPMCRHELPTDDPEYETKRKEREAEKQQQNELRSSQRGATPANASSSSSSDPSTSQSTTSTVPASTQTPPNRQQNTMRLTESQEALLEEAIYISSDSESPSMDIDEYFDTAEDDSHSSSGERDYPDLPSESDSDSHNAVNPNFDVD